MGLGDERFRGWRPSRAGSMRQAWRTGAASENRSCVGHVWTAPAVVSSAVPASRKNSRNSAGSVLKTKAIVNSSGPWNGHAADDPHNAPPCDHSTPPGTGFVSQPRPEVTGIMFQPEPIPDSFGRGVVIIVCSAAGLSNAAPR